MQNATILIVDDSPTIQRLVSKTLDEKIGVKHILPASNGIEALAILRKEKIDIIISDWNMPKMDGEEFLYQVKNDPALKHIPFIMMTTHSERDYIVTAIQLGATNYLVKPFTPEELEGKMRLIWSILDKRNKPNQTALPPHTAKLRIDNRNLEGQVINLSQTGAKVSLQNDTVLGLFKACQMTIFLIDPQKTDSDTALITNLNSTIVRLEAQDSFHPSSTACNMDLYFNPTKIDKELSAKLNKVLNWLSKKAQDVIDDTKSEKEAFQSGVKH